MVSTMKRATQMDVARAAGVSRATVSNVVNDREGRIPIAPATKRKVLAAIEELGYEPDARAQSLRSGQSKTLGLLVPDIRNPHYWQVVEGSEMEARRAGYDILLVHTALDQDQEEVCLQALSRRTIAGLLILKSVDSLRPESAQELLASRRPVAEIGSPTPTEVPGFDCVKADYRQGAAEMLDHLLELGHRRFAFVNGVSDPRLGVDRLDAFRSKLGAAGVPREHARIETCGVTPDEGYRTARALLEDESPPTALVVINDLLAIGAVRAAYDLGLRVPGDVSVVGFDDQPISRHLVPRLTTVRRKAVQEGRLATKLLLRRLRDPDKRPRLVHAQTELVIRESSGAPPSE